MSIKQWNDAAASYAAEQERSAFAEANREIVKKRFPKLNGEAVLDLGCGYGRYTEYFRSIGGRPVGIDGAETMIEIARKKYPDCPFTVADITRPLPFDDDTFDIVFCNMVLMDIDPVDSVFAECHRVLKPGGTFCFSIVHPAFFNGDWQTDENGCQTGKLISSYLTPCVSENRFWGETAHYHRPLSFYLNAAADAGFLLKSTEEPRTYDGVTKNDDLPLFFFADFHK